MLAALTLTAAGVGAAPLVSDLGVHPADGPGTLLWLAAVLFGVGYGAVLGLSVVRALLRASPPAPPSATSAREPH